MRNMLFLLLVLQGCSYLENQPLKFLNHEAVNSSDKIKIPPGYKVNFDSNYALDFNNVDINKSELTVIQKPPL